MEFQPWPKIGRLFRDIVITEKIDGTNAAVIIEEGIYHDADPSVIDTVFVDGAAYSIGAQSRKRLITPSDDNFGFATWVKGNATTLTLALGPGRHFGEWWGKGIQRGYGLNHKRFSLFNVSRYDPELLEGAWIGEGVCIDTVPTLWDGPFSEAAIVGALESLRWQGSYAAPGFKNPEGIVVFHTATGSLFKVTLEGDEKPKGQG